VVKKPKGQLTLKMDFIKMPADTIKNGCFQSFIGGVFFYRHFL